MKLNVGIRFNNTTINMHLLSLPPDLLLSIADFTPEPSLNALLQTTSSLHTLLDPHLYRSNIRHSQSNALLWASLYGNATVVRKLLAHHADPNTTAVRRRRNAVLPESATNPGSSRMLNILEGDVKRGHVAGLASPLVYAAAGGHVDVMAMLIAHGADVHRTGNTGSTSTGYGRRNSNAARSKSRSKSASSNGCCHYTPLMMAADRGHTAAIELLLSHGVDINTPLARCHSPLSLSAINGHVPAVRTLLRHGADVNVPRRRGTALIKAIQAGRVDVVRVLLHEGKADVAVSSQQDLVLPAIFCAVSMDNPEMISLLLEYAPAELERQDTIGRTPLALAAWEEKFQAMECLLSHGADVNAKNHHGQTPLWWAVLAVSAPGTRSLLRARADTEVLAPADGLLMPVLLAAMKRFYYEVVEVLLEFGADPNCSSISIPDRRSGTGRRRDNGMVTTALSLAVQQREPSLVGSLLYHGASPNSRDENSWNTTPLYWAITNCDTALVDTLLSHGADPNALVRTKGRQRGRVPPLLQAMKLRQWETALLLVAHGAGPNESWDGTPVLVKVVGKGHLGLTRMMLDGGALIDVVDRHGRSPESLASVKKDTHMQALLSQYRDGLYSR